MVKSFGGNRCSLLFLFFLSIGLFVVREGMLFLYIYDGKVIFLFFDI